MDATRAFFAEWDGRTPGARRSLRRARLLAERIGADPGVPVLTVVGSKGKGTAATYASAYLAAHGLRVLTVTGPPPRRDTERIRVNGTAVSERELAELGARLGEAARALPPEPGGYLSPSGLFTIAGVLHARTVGADLIVLEAGMGGASDEVAVFPPTVAAITAVFAEHVGVLGDTPAEIAVEKAGVVADGTSAVVSLRQPPDVTEAIAATVADRTGGAVTPEVIGPGASGVPERLLPEGFGRMNAELGCVAARRLLDAVAPRPAPRTPPRPAAGGRRDGSGGPPGDARTCGRRPGRIAEATVSDTAPDRATAGGTEPGAPPVGDRLARVLSTVRLPGRASWHPVPGTRSAVFVDSAIDRSGAAAALAQVYGRWGGVDHVLVCLPDHKDVPGVIAELAGLPVTYVRMPDHPHLRFTHPIPDGWAVLDAAGLTRERLAALGERIAVLGTVYFTARVLDLVDADTERLFVA